MGRKRIGAIEMGPTELADRLKVGGPWEELRMTPGFWLWHLDEGGVIYCWKEIRPKKNKTAFRAEETKSHLDMLESMMPVR